MSESTARIGVASRHALAVFWGLVAVACVGLVLMPKVRASPWFFVPPAAGVILFAAAWSFYRGRRSGRTALGVLVAPFTLVCFDRLLLYFFAHRIGLHFWVCCLLLGVSCFTWIALFAGLDRDAPTDGD
jgi:hypothetical protein